MWELEAGRQMAASDGGRLCTAGRHNCCWWWRTRNTQQPTRERATKTFRWSSRSTGFVNRDISDEIQCVSSGKTGLICSIGCCYTVPRRHILRHVQREGKAAVIGWEQRACSDWLRARTRWGLRREQSIHTKEGPLTCVRHRQRI